MRTSVAVIVLSIIIVTYVSLRGLRALGQNESDKIKLQMGCFVYYIN